MAECTSNCSTCGKECEERRAESMLASLHEKAKVKKVIGIVLNQSQNLLINLIYGMQQ